MSANQKPIRKLAAIMFTDIAGFTKLSSVDDTKAVNLLNTQRDLLKPIVEKFGGNWLKEMGDGLLITYSGATNALECAVEIQKATKDIENLNLRIGIHQGEIIDQKGDVIGDDVNIASRIEPFSAIGGIAISDKVQRDISSNPKFNSKYIGRPKFKGVQQEVKVYCITSHNLPKTKLSDVSAKLERRHSRVMYLISALVIFSFIGFFLLPKEAPSIGILMMENMGKEVDEFWARGITEDLIIKIAGAGLIRVTPMKEILKINLNQTFEEIAEKLSVKYILTSSIQKKKDGFNLRSQLLEAGTGVSLFANKWSEPLIKSPSIVGTLAENILKILNVSTKQDIAKVPTINPDAYEFYLKGKYKYEIRQNMEDTEISRGLFHKAIEIDENLLEAKRSLGLTYKETGSYDQALKIYNETINHANKTHNKIIESNVMIDIGSIWRAKGEYDKSAEYINKSIHLSEELNNKNLMMRANGTLGNIYYSQGMNDTALYYYNKSKNVALELGNKTAHGKSLNGIANIEDELGNYKSSMANYKKALDIFLELGNKRAIYLINNNIGGIKIRIGDYENGIKYFMTSLENLREINSKPWIAALTHNIGSLHRFNENFDLSLKYLFESLDLARTLDNNPMIVKAQKEICFTFIEMGKEKNALFHIEEADSLKSKLNEVSSLNLVIRILLAYCKKLNNMSYEELLKQIEIEYEEEKDIGINSKYFISKLVENDKKRKYFLNEAYNGILNTIEPFEPKYKKKFLSKSLIREITLAWDEINK